METLSLLGIHTDGEHLVLVGTTGERYLLPIEEELRSIVRQHRRKVAAVLEVKNPGSIRPREIQSMIRAGATAEEVASAAGVDLEHVKRYEDPVLSERIWAWQQAGETRVSSDPDAPELRDLVVDRLATRGVDPASLHWDATRQPGEEWVVHLEFVQDAKNFEANWEFDMDNRVLTALDEQSRWLTETATPAGSETLLRRSIFPAQSPSEESSSAGGAVVASGGVGSAAGGAADAAASGVMRSHPETSPPSTSRTSLEARTEALLDELNAARGTRLTVVTGEEDDDVSAMEAAIASGFREDAPTETPQTGVSPSAAVTKLPSRPDANPKTGQSAPENPAAAPLAPHESAAPETTPTPDAGVLPGMEQSAQPRTPAPAKSAPPKRSRTGRAQMPSWDEIMFGSKSD